MSNIAIFYATYSTSTQVASEILKSELEKNGHSVEIFDVQSHIPQNLNQFDLTIVASPSWLERGEQGMPHAAWLEHMDNLPGESISGGKYAVLGLGDTNYTHFCQAVDHLTNWLTGNGGKIAAPTHTIDRYFFNEETANQELATWAQVLGRIISR